jgi:hypothetical protein
MKGSSCTYLRRGGLREALTGHDFEGALKVLASVGALPPPNAKGEYAKTVRMPGVKPSRLYEINPENSKTRGAEVAFVTSVTSSVLFDVTPLPVENAGKYWTSHVLSIWSCLTNSLRTRIWSRSIAATS